MAYADDIQIRATVQNEPFSEIHVTGLQNVIGVIAFTLPANHPFGPLTHKAFRFFGFQAPGTDYPDSIAPIGSEYLQYTVAGGVVTGFRVLHKTAANTWTVIGSVA